MNKTNCSTLEGFHERLRAKGFEHRFGITVDTPYIGAKTVITVTCDKHGKSATSASGLLKTKHGCPGCAGDVKSKLATGRILGNHTVTEDLFWTYVRDYGFDKRFTIMLEPYHGVLTSVKLECPDHGVHSTIVGDIMRSKYGCPACARRRPTRGRAPRSKKKKATKTVSDFLAELKLPARISIEDVAEYIAPSKGSVTTVCELHGVNKWSPPRSLSLTKFGCRSCAQNARDGAKTNTWDDFIGRARAVFGDRFEYQDNYSYENMRSHVSVVCVTHGAQKILANKHVVAGQYCAQCRKDDLRVSGKLVGYVGDAIERDPSFGDTPARLYYVRIGKLYKIGISWAADPKSRFRALRRESGKEVEVLEVVECSLLEAYTWEQQILTEFAEHRVARSWSTELFNRDVFSHSSLSYYTER